MNRGLISDTVIPARQGAAFEVNRGQVLRIYPPESAPDRARHRRGCHRARAHNDDRQTP